MILAEKENLKAETAVEVLRLREHEMSYYSQSISLMATQATLLAGFTFAMLAATSKGRVVSIPSSTRRPYLPLSEGTELGPPVFWKQPFLSPARAARADRGRARGDPSLAKARGSSTTK